jgi:hypothetical protein
MDDLFEEGIFIFFHRGTESTALAATARSTATLSAAARSTARAATGSSAALRRSRTVHLSDDGTLSCPCFGFRSHDIRILRSRGAGHRNIRGFGFWSLIVFFSH